MLDWSNITAFQEVVSTPKPAASIFPTQLPPVLTHLIESFGVDAKQFNLGRPVTVVSEDPTWTDRIVDRFTSYLDLKILQFQEWISQKVFNFGQGCLMFVIAGGQLFCFVYGVSVVYRMMINTKKDEDYITKGILAAGGYVLCRSLEVAIFGV